MPMHSLIEILNNINLFKTSLVRPLLGVILTQVNTKPLNPFNTGGGGPYGPENDISPFLPLYGQN
jgi:hypothetical protein